jgi:hypothetical protein
LTGESIDLGTAPEAVRWVQLDGQQDHERRLQAARTRAPNKDGRVLIIGDSTSPAGQRQFASQTPGAVTVEAVDLKDLVSFARDLDLRTPDALARVAGFAQTVMTNVGADDLVRRTRSLSTGKARNPPTETEAAALAFLADPTHREAINLLVEIGKQGGVRTHRPGVFAACLRALRLCDGPQGLSFHDAAIQVREQNRLMGRTLPLRAVGSTLLLKGLEADVSVVLHAGELDARNLYVAMTRGSRRLILCSPTQILKPIS